MSLKVTDKLNALAAMPYLFKDLEEISKIFFIPVVLHYRLM